MAGMDASISYDYSKPRKEFGIRPAFDDAPAKHMKIKRNEEDSEQWTERIVTTVELDCIPRMAIHEANTERFVQQQAGVSHTEGSWPAEVKTTEFVDRQRMLRRIKNEGGYQKAVVDLVDVAEMAIQQNNTIDLFEEYFQEVEEEYASEPPSCRTLAVFKDPNDIKRAATKIAWHPDLANKVAVCYSIKQFQQMPDNMPVASYIWDVNSPNQPDATILPQSPLCSLKYNPRSPDHLVGGSYNGLVAFWDLRKGSQPSQCSQLEHSHHDPVYDVQFIQSRAGNEVVSVSTDGQLLWWDTRNLEAGPIDTMLLETDECLYGGISMEYRSDAGATRYLMGTEQGTSILVDRKAKKDAESTKSIKTVFGAGGYGSHFGPAYSIARNPFNSKYFMTVGDWTARLYMEDLKSPLITTPFDGTYLTGGCWSPTRPGVFFTIKKDGMMDSWDYHFKQNQPVFSSKISERGLSSIAMQQSGRHVALGAEDGTTTVLELSGALADQQPGEKANIAAMFDRELRREKNLEVRAMQRKREARPASGAPARAGYDGDDPDAEDDAETKTRLAEVEADFHKFLDEQKAKREAKDAAEAN